MDPISLLGVVGSVLSISDVVVKSIQRLTRIRNTYRNAPILITTLIGQLHIVQAALNQLCAIRDAEALKPNPRYQQLATQMDAALESFGPLMLSLEARLDSLNDEEQPMTAKNKLAFLWNEGEINDFFTLVDRQANALNLLLNAIQCRTWADRQRIIDDNDSQLIIRLARDCSSSIIGCSDRRSIVTEDTNNISVNFEFDNLILGCGPYLSAHRSNLRLAIRATHLEPESDHLLSSDRGSTSSYTPGDDQSEAFTVQSNSDYTVADDVIAYSAEIGEGEQHSCLIQLRSDITTHIVGAIDEIAETTSLRRNPLTCFLLFDQLNRKWEVNVLILGCSGSGKTTLRSGLKYLADPDYTREGKDYTKNVIFNNILRGCHTVLVAMSYLGLSLSNRQSKDHARTIMMRAIPITDKNDHVLADVIAANEILWADEAFRMCYARRHEYQVDDFLEYYAKLANRLQRQNYVLNAEDILRYQSRGTGTFRTDIPYRNLLLRCWDIIPEKLWSGWTNNMQLIIFTVDATAHETVLFDDGTSHSMDDQLREFDKTVNLRWFRETQFILAFTKVDLVKQRFSEDHSAYMPPNWKPEVDERTSGFDKYMTHLKQRFMNVVPEHHRSLRVAYANLVDLNTYDGPGIRELWNRSADQLIGQAL